MKITFLGTGTSQGVPVIACECDVCRSSDPKDIRLRSSVMIEHNGTNLVIDSGPDFRQQIADSWPNSIDDSVARNDWNWKEQFTIAEMTSEMITQIRKRYFQNAGE